MRKVFILVIVISVLGGCGYGGRFYDEYEQYGDYDYENDLYSEEELEEAYNEGLKEGHEIGFEEGYDDGYTIGYDDGAEIGYEYGYDEGVWSHCDD